MHGNPSALAEYKKLAAECVRIAQDMNDSTSKVQLLEMALSWIELSEYAARDFHPQNVGPLS
jgi:hypothetical protein